MAEIYQIDNLDRGILNALMENARTPYAELDKVYNVSPGTIHEREDKKNHYRRLHTGEPKKIGLRRLLLYRHHFKKC